MPTRRIYSNDSEAIYYGTLKKYNIPEEFKSWCQKLTENLQESTLVKTSNIITIAKADSTCTLIIKASATSWIQVYSESTISAGNLLK